MTNPKKWGYVSGGVAAAFTFGVALTHHVGMLATGASSSILSLGLSGLAGGLIAAFFWPAVIGIAVGMYVFRKNKKFRRGLSARQILRARLQTTKNKCFNCRK